MSPRFVAAVLLPVAAAAIGLALVGGTACVQTQRSLGEDCLKDQDCLSGICSQLQCAAAPPLLDGAAQAPPPEAGSDAVSAPETGAMDSAAPVPDAPPDVAPDTAAPGDDASGDSASDAPSE